jgi:mono/diheme cytochrome c family protein
VNRAAIVLIAARLLCLVCMAVAAHAAEPLQGDAQKGAYLAKAGGCVACHTEEREGAVAYAGGRALRTPFGTFYGPNITADRDTGIGRWTVTDFIEAMRHGRRPDGANYFPAFPYTSFTHMTDADLGDLWAYLRTLPPVRRANQSHELRFPFGWRFAVGIWKRLYFTPGPLTDAPGVPPAVNRGAYLVRAVSHCGECHTPRNFAGGPARARELAGGKGADGKRVPNLTPTRLKSWSDDELREFFLTGVMPDGDAANKTMDEVIRNTTSRLTPADRDAMIAYLRTLAPLPDEPK